MEYPTAAAPWPLEAPGRQALVLSSPHSMTKALFAALLVLPAALFAASDYAWLAYGPNGPIARAIVAGGGPCPSIVIDGKAQPMTLRAPSSSDYDVTSCESAVPAGAATASVGGGSGRVHRDTTAAA